MGLDWCLKNRVRPGMENEYVDVCLKLDELDGSDETSNEERDRLRTELIRRRREVSIPPEETLGVPRIGIDEVATEHFLKVILPSYRVAIEQEKERDPALRNEKFIKHWSKPDEELLRESHGYFVPELAQYDCRGVQAYGAFKALAGEFSFRGKVIGNSSLLTEKLQEEAYEDMEPEDMEEYAGRIEGCAIKMFVDKMRGMGNTIQTDSLQMLEALAEQVHVRVEKATDECLEIAKKQEGQADREKGKLSPDAAREFMPWQLYEPTEEEELWLLLRIVLQAAAWLRFWAEKGHAMHAWY